MTINKLIINKVIMDFNKYFDELDEQLFGMKGNELIKKYEQILLTIL